MLYMDTAEITCANLEISVSWFTNKLVTVTVEGMAYLR